MVKVTFKIWRGDAEFSNGRIGVHDAFLPYLCPGVVALGGGFQ